MFKILIIICSVLSVCVYVVHMKGGHLEYNYSKTPSLSNAHIPFALNLPEFYTSGLKEAITIIQLAVFIQPKCNWPLL